MWRKIIYIMLAIVLVFGFPISVQAAVTINNDGQVKSTPYGDSKLPSCYEGTDYADCFVPYKMTCGQIGGYAVGVQSAAHQVTTGGGSAMSQSIVDSPCCSTVTMEAPYSYAVSHNWLLVKYANPTGCKVETEPDTLLNYVVDSNGNKYYMFAVQPFFFRHHKAGQNGFPADDHGGFGEVIDVVLTDGTCIHFICFDINAAQHTNGVDNSGAGAFDYIYSNSKLNYEQYNNLFSTQNGNSMEIWMDKGSGVQAFKDKFNFGSEEGKNKIALYRMYNTFLKDGPKRANGVGQEPFFSYGDVNISSDGEKDSEEMLSEWGLTGMPEKSKLMDNSKEITLVDDSSLGVKEQYSVSVTRQDMGTSKTVKVIDTARIVTVFVGLILLFYAIFLVIAGVFDRANQFIEVSAISMITFGKVKYLDDDYPNEADGVITTAKLVKIIAIVFAVGLFLVSGGMFLYVSKFILFMMDKLM